MCETRLWSICERQNRRLGVAKTRRQVQPGRQAEAGRQSVCSRRRRPGVRCLGGIARGSQTRGRGPRRKFDLPPFFDGLGRGLISSLLAELLLLHSTNIQHRPNKLDRGHGRIDRPKKCGHPGSLGRWTRALPSATPTRWCPAHPHSYLNNKRGARSHRRFLLRRPTQAETQKKAGQPNIPSGAPRVAFGHMEQDSRKRRRECECEEGRVGTRSISDIIFFYDNKSEFSAS